MATKTLKLNALTWGQRFAVIEAYKLTDEQVLKHFGMIPAEWRVAKQLLAKKTYQVDDSFDTTPYVATFDPSKVVKLPVKSSGKTSDDSTDASQVKKRGRKGDKISTAFRAITTTPVPVEAFTAKYDVSLAVLRQAKRFDNSGLGGNVHVRKKDGVVMVWRDTPAVAIVTTTSLPDMKIVGGNLFIEKAVTVTPKAFIDNKQLEDVEAA